MAGIELKHVYKRFPDGAIGVNDANLTIDDGEFIILVGPSGCGKSTMLNMIAGLEDITDGDLLIDGKRMNDVAPKDRDIAMVFQSYALYPNMTVRENIAFPLKLAKKSKSEIDEKVNNAARVLDLEEYLDRKPSQLSGGQRQRVAMGRAIVRRPKVFLMDEPLSNLDAKLRVQMRTEISQLQENLGVTTVYVTHDQTEAMTLGDRVVVMKKGLIQQVGLPQELYNRPKNLFVAGFIGSPSMNFLPGHISADGNTVSTALGDVPITGALKKRLTDAAVEGSRDGVSGGSDSAGRRVIVGFRPEAFEDAAIVERSGVEKPGVHTTVKVEVLEAMGSEIFIHFTPEGDAAADLPHLPAASEAGLEETHSDMLVARLSAESRAKRGQDIELWFNPEKMSLFDADDGRNLGL